MNNEKIVKWLLERAMAGEMLDSSLADDLGLSDEEIAQFQRVLEERRERGD